MEASQDSPDFNPKTPAHNSYNTMEGGKGNKRLFSDLAYEQQKDAEKRISADNDSLFDPNGPQSDKRPRAADWPLTSSRVLVEAEATQKRSTYEHSSDWDEPLKVLQTQPRPSRFYEGSMNNRHSTRPPPVFLGNTTPEPKEYIEPKSPKTPFYARSIKKLKRQLPHPAIATLGHGEKPANDENPSTMFKFGKSIAATFNPAKWKLWPKGQQNEQKVEGAKATERKSQEEIDAAYQAIKAKGYVQGNRPAALATPHKSVTQASIESKYGRPFPGTPTADRHAPYNSSTARRPSILDPEAFEMPAHLSTIADEEPHTPHLSKPIFTAKEMESHKKIFDKVNDLELKLSLARQELAEAMRTPSAAHATTLDRRTDNDNVVPPVPSLRGSNQSDEAVINTDEDSHSPIGQDFSENEGFGQVRNFSDNSVLQQMAPPGPGPYEREMIAIEAEAIASGQLKRDVRPERSLKSRSSRRGHGDDRSSRIVQEERSTIGTRDSSSSSKTLAKKGVKVHKGALDASGIDVSEDKVVVAKAEVLESNAESFEKARKVSKKKSFAGIERDLENGTMETKHLEGDQLDLPKTSKKRTAGETSLKPAKPKSRIPRRGDTFAAASTKATQKKAVSGTGMMTEESEAESRTMTRTKSSRSLRSDNSDLASELAAQRLAVPVPSLAAIDAQTNQNKRRKSVTDLKENKGGRSIKQPRSFDNSRPSSNTQEKAMSASARSRSKDRQREMSPSHEAFEWGSDVF